METTPAPLETPAIVPQPQPSQPTTKFPINTYGFLGLGAIIIAIGLVAYNGRQENQRLQFLTIINHAENRVLKAEIHSLERAAETKPSYEDGYKEALVRAGRPNNPGAYQDGYEAAIKVVGDGGYATGYHTAIKQFGYQPNKSLAILIDEPTSIKKDQSKTINANDK